MNFLLYLLQVHIALTLLYMAYKALFSRDTHFAMRRFLLLGILLFAITFPLYRIPVIGQAVPQVLQVSLSELQVSPTDENATPATLDLYRLAAWLYGGIALLLGLRIGVRLISIIGLRLRGKIHRQEGLRLVICRDEIQPCSFFNWIFLPASMLHRPEALDKILKHEGTHIKQMHSADILLGECMAALCWINPVSWLLLKEIRLNLEYLADRTALLDEPETRSYQYLLLDLVNNNPTHTSAIPFSHSFLKARIAMINRKRSSRWSLCLYPLVAPLLLLLIVGSQSCQQSSGHKVQNDNSIQSTTSGAQPQTAIPREVPEQEPVFEVAEVMPEFPGGNQALFEFIAENLKYPQEAIDNQTEGRVILQFVVDKEGKVGHIQVVRSIDKMLDQAAIDVVRTLPDWKPGMQDGQPVNVRYTLPIAFKLQ